MEIKKEVKIKWRLGLHIRPSTYIVKILQDYSADITFNKDEISCDARSLIQLLTLEAGIDESIIIKAKGNDAKEALDSLVKFFDEYRDEDESENNNKKNNNNNLQSW